VIRVGRYGPYLDRDGARVNVPDDMTPDELTAEKAEELFARPSGDRELGKDPATGHLIVAKDGRFGPYVTEVLPEEPPAEPKSDGKSETRRRTKKAEAVKPRTSSLFKSMSLDTITLDQALTLLTLPRVVGHLDGEEVTAQNGRFGPYIKKGTDSRSLASEDELLTITIEQAKEVFAQPKVRGRGRAAAAPPLRELGEDPGSKKPVVVKEGRFGPYVTDGETNASLRKGDSVESITIERAAELLAERRARGPAPKRPTRTRAPKATAKS
jgi:DNA topoisomerase-1